MENIEDMNWDDLSPTPEDMEELKKIRRSIRRRNWLTILTSVAVVAALIIGAIYVGIPALESRYWDPNVSTYSEFISDLEFAMSAYSELFVPTYNVSAVEVNKTGFASYELSLLCFNEKNRNEWFWSSASLDRSELHIPNGLWDYAIIGTFGKTGTASKQSRQTLNQLPEYIKVQAAVCFPEDLSMGGIVDLENWLFTYDMSSTISHLDNTINWVAIRTSDEAESVYPLCGMKPFTSTFANNLIGEINDYYPKFSINNSSSGYFSKANLERHFLALLNYSLDQVNKGTGILPEYSKPSEDYYRSILDYVAENGIYSYGCVITATPQMLLELLDDGTISGIHILDIWIGF